MNILITGGAGYIGSHVVKHFGEKTPHNITVIDNLSSGFKEAVLYGEFIEADLADTGKLENIFAVKNFDAVVHFAANIEVEESVKKPLKYYKNNTVNSANLIDIAIRHQTRCFIFSSTAAVYGSPKSTPVKEDNAKEPLNPYGKSKLMTEHILMDAASASGLKYCILRYFNVAGADASLRIGQRTPNATHLIKAASQAALGIREQLYIYGTDYDTADGTGVRDYIHVDDLADAHLKGLEHLENHGSCVFNCGYGTGYSVKEVITEIKKVSGVDFKVIETGRRAGDAALLIADNSRILQETSWRPLHNNLEYICKTAFEWEKKLTTL
ncbi:MAG: UDP-glucose 4-epimerase GalE [Leptospirales bacterium]|nr:UDP-glucose 4-epimerase GalE [Leptospirales bacterium]